MWYKVIILGKKVNNIGSYWENQRYSNYRGDTFSINYCLWDSKYEKYWVNELSVSLCNNDMEITIF